MKKIFRVTNACALWFVVSFAALVPYGWATRDDKPAQPAGFSIDYQNTTALQALIDFSVRNQIPIGIVLVSDSGLCAPRERLAMKNAPAEKIMDSLLVNSGYAWSNNDGVFVIKPKVVPETSDRVLRLKYPRFKSTATTLQGLGIVLSGLIRSSLESGGYATSILSSSDSTTVKPFTLENVTVEEIANYIVRLNGKGAWILEPNPYESGQVKKGRLQIYGYGDDAGSLKSLSCPAQAKLPQ